MIQFLDTPGEELALGFAGGEGEGATVSRFGSEGVGQPSVEVSRGRVQRQVGLQGGFVLERSEGIERDRRSFREGLGNNGVELHHR